MTEQYSITIGEVLWIFAATTMAFILSVTQSLFGSKMGSDTPVHSLIMRAIRKNNYRLFVRVPGLCNTLYCGGLPLYIHWLLSHFGTAMTVWAERLLNPMVNTIHVFVFAFIAILASRQEGLPIAFVGLTVCLFALTPQFYHALSARNFGLGARGTGLLFLTLFLFACYGVETGSYPAFYWPMLITTGWLIWGFSTFAQQALCIISLLLLVISGRFIPLAGNALGLLLFIALHPKYSLGYLKHTLRFIHAYATQLAPIYILKRRKSVWRDLVWDIWLRLIRDPKSGLPYAYENPVLVVALLNSMVLVACWGELSHIIPSTGIIAYAGAVSLAGLIAVVLTSFRSTRFLGEPERYAEAVTPWAVVTGAYVIQCGEGVAVLILPISLFLVFNLAQMYGSMHLRNYLTSKPVKLQELASVIKSRLGDRVRCCSNNEEMTKMLMRHDWHFACGLSAGQAYCGMTFPEAYSVFPLLRREACERIVTTYRINVCVLDRNCYDTIFDVHPPELQSMKVVIESEAIRVLVLRWAGEV